MGIVVVQQRRFVAPEQHMALDAGIGAALGRGGHHVVLLLHHRVEAVEAFLEAVPGEELARLLGDVEAVRGVGAARVVAVREDAHDVHGAGIDQEDGVRIDEVDGERHRPERPFVGVRRLAAKLLEALHQREHHAVVHAEGVVGLQVAANVAGQRVAVQHVEVVVLAEGVHGQLPVDVGVDRLRCAVAVARQIPVRHVVFEAAQHGVHVDLAAGRGLHPQHAVAFRSRQFDEAEARLVDLAEALLAVHGDQVAGAGVGPSVERAAEAVALAASIRHHLGAAMAAGVGEGVEDAVFVAGHQDGQAGGAVRPVGAGFRQIGRKAHEERRLAEEDAAFFRQQIGAGEVLERTAHDAFAVNLAGPLVETRLQNAQQPLALFDAHGCLPLCFVALRPVSA